MINIISDDIKVKPGLKNHKSNKILRKGGGVRGEALTLRFLNGNTENPEEN